MSAPYCRAPAELPDLRLWLRNEWTPGHVLSDMAAPAMADRLNHHRGVSLPSALAAWELRMLSGATLWWVGAEMVDVLMAAAASIPDDATVEDLPKPSHSGLVMFEKPWWGHDADTSPEEPGAATGPPVEVDLMVWGTDNLYGRWYDGTAQASLPSVSVSSYKRVVFEEGLGKYLGLAAEYGTMNHARLERVSVDRATEIGDRGVGTLVMNRESGGQGVIDYSQVEPHEGHTKQDVIRAHAEKEPCWEARGCSWLPLGRSDWPLRDRLGTQPFELDAASWASFSEDRRILAALWLMLRTKAITATRVREDRPARRRTERAGLPANLSDVRVVTLREPERTGEPTEPRTGESGVDWSCRWIVGVHPCWQPYGPGRSQRKLIMRGPFIKGPAGKPLHTPTVVNAWVR